MTFILIPRRRRRPVAPSISLAARIGAQSAALSSFTASQVGTVSGGGGGGGPSYTTGYIDRMESGGTASGSHKLFEIYAGEGAAGTIDYASTPAARVGSKGMRVTLTAGTFYMHAFTDINWPGGANWRYLHEFIQSGTAWTQGAFNMLSMWVRHPSNQPEGTVPGAGALVELGTYTKIKPSDGADGSQNLGGDHFYHFFSPRSNVWTKVYLDGHPNHSVGLDPNIPIASKLNNPTTSTNWNYFDALTRMYWNCINGQAPSSYPATFDFDEVILYNDPYMGTSVEDLDNIMSIEVSYNSGTQLLHVGFTRMVDVDPTFTVRWSDNDMHVTGFSSGTLLGSSGPDGAGAYVMRKVEGTVDLSAKTGIYVAIQRTGAPATLFRQVYFELV